MSSATPSFTAVCHGNVWMVTPMNSEAQAWVDENVPLDDWQWIGRGFSVDQHYVENLIEGIAEAGFTIKVIR